MFRNVETIKKQWEEQREKLVLDYKKKTREVVNLLLLIVLLMVYSDVV